MQDRLVADQHRKTNFFEWIRELDEDVIQGENGFQKGEFDISLDLWAPLYREGLTPLEAWQKAIKYIA